MLGGVITPRTLKKSHTENSDLFDKRIAPPSPEPRLPTGAGDQKYKFLDSDVPDRMKTNWSMMTANIPGREKVDQ